MCKSFFRITSPESNPYWQAVENEGEWSRMDKNQVYNRFQNGPQILITDYARGGISEIRAWSGVKSNPKNNDRSGENYNRLAYNSAFPWMQDGANGEVAMNYLIKQDAGKWEPLRLYTFKEFENGIFYRNAELQSNSEVKINLADITLPGGILRVDKIKSPVDIDVRLGHYALPEKGNSIQQSRIKLKNGETAYIISNGEYSQAMVIYEGWQRMSFVNTQGLHPESKKCTVIDSEARMPYGERIFITLQLWKKGKVAFTGKELNLIKKISITDNKQSVEIQFNDNTKKHIDLGL
ncbi:MAG: hypothetical protein QM751_11285 [Paludibacteraceae bacterium]